MAEGGGMGGFWTILVFFIIVVGALWFFFDLLGFTPNTGPTGAAAAK